MIAVALAEKVCLNCSIGIRMFVFLQSCFGLTHTSCLTSVSGEYWRIDLLRGSPSVVQQSWTSQLGAGKN
ncbi:hypothetical protein DUNSADRAFT_15818 [Dunaliella salina]|uniref:Secreted protein n=1 Tax=Dunaliella salina TaxID=3046 RepID=A0ABQ7H1I6_DUNSA|nr:hypothetical protein DUNSADRAFT_15818 [Dunaliella salina]|eukprot:KAF5840723.1 hypothetical protein DUNSADRAFT_15818 [Dunaliella salina]